MTEQERADGMNDVVGDLVARLLCARVGPYNSAVYPPQTAARDAIICLDILYAADTIIALAAERDGAIARAEAAEAEVGRSAPVALEDKS